MTGGAQAWKFQQFFLEIPTADRNTFDKAIQALKNRYLSANRIELFKQKFQEQKFNLSRATPEDYLTDLTRLANLAFPNPTGGDELQERTRRIRDAFISGMPSQIRLKLLMEPDTKTVQELCTFVSKRLALKGILPDEEAISTAFNALSFNETTNSMTEALISIAATNRELIKTQKELGNNMQRFLRIINQREPYRGFMRSRGSPNYNNYRGQNSFANRHNAFKIPTEEEVTCFATAVDNQDTKKVTAGFERYQNVRQTSHSTDITLQKLKKSHYLTAIVPACKIENFFY